MDIKRAPKSKIKKKIRTAVMIVIGLAGIGGITYGLTKLKPAAPTLDRSTAVIETVKRGEMIRDVRGNGTLVPEITRWVPAPAEGRVEKINLQAGVTVEPSTVLVELSNPQVEQQATDADFQVKAAEADEENLKVKLESDEMTQKAPIATIKAQYSQAKLKLEQADSLKGRAGTAGVLQIVSVQVGQQVTQGLNIARVADPASLKAVLRVPETQIKDMRVGNPVTVDTRNGLIQGTVARIDPAAREGTSRR